MIEKESICLSKYGIMNLSGKHLLCSNNMKFKKKIKDHITITKQNKTKK